VSSTVIALLVVLVVVGVVAFSMGWVLRDARARAIPRGKAATWAALQWIEFPLFLWLYRRARPKRTRSPSGADVPLGTR
jgi:heme/copper-type cytochrome/quinol oxidase subunit 2